jgi:hypothetical protein
MTRKQGGWLHAAENYFAKIAQNADSQRFFRSLAVGEFFF